MVFCSTVEFQCTVFQKFWYVHSTKCVNVFAISFSEYYLQCIGVFMFLSFQLIQGLSQDQDLKTVFMTMEDTLMTTPSTIHTMTGVKTLEMTIQDLLIALLVLSSGKRTITMNSTAVRRLGTGTLATWHLGTGSLGIRLHTTGSTGTQHLAIGNTGTRRPTIGSTGAWFHTTRTTALLTLGNPLDHMKLILVLQIF